MRDFNLDDEIFTTDNSNNNANEGPEPGQIVRSTIEKKITSTLGNSPKKKSVSFNFITTNARSLAPKMDSLVDYFSELDLQFAVITESWLKNGEMLKEAVIDLNAGCSLDMLTHNRKAKRSGRTAGGGVALVYDKKCLKMNELLIRKGRSEIICASAKVPGLSRRLVVIGIYLPPSIRAEKRKKKMGCIRDAIAHAKGEFRDPIKIVTGDTNKMALTEATEDYPDIVIHEVGATRGSSKLDVINSNIPDSRLTMSIHPPLEEADGRTSDHNVILAEVKMPNSDRFVKKSFLARKRTKTADKKMMDWLSMEDWLFLEKHMGAEEKAAAFVGKVETKKN